MRLFSTYKHKIKHYSKIFRKTIVLYRSALQFFIDVCMDNWELLNSLGSQKKQYNKIERLTIRTKKNPDPRYDFSKMFYKFPCYLRRAAIAEALGKVSSYMSSLKNWKSSDPATRGKKPGLPKAGYDYPAMYKENMFIHNGKYTIRLKVFIRNTWDWITIEFRKSDVDYVDHHCFNRKECTPILRKRGKEWFLDFSYEETVGLINKEVTDQKILAVDLGLNNTCVCSVMDAKGTIYGREFYKLPKEYDSLHHALNRLKKAQQHGARRVPRLWARVNGINDHIATKTASFIENLVSRYDVDVVVMEHLDLQGKRHGSKKQRLHHWRAQYIQSMVTDKIHRMGKRISHVCAWGTSRLAFDGSGRVLRGKESSKTPNNYSLCEFQTGKVYNCDLNAAYNIGARYFIRELTKSLTETSRLVLDAKIPRVTKRSTCTWVDLIKVNAVLAA